jgi:hypothetical protein
MLHLAKLGSALQSLPDKPIQVQGRRSGFASGIDQEAALGKAGIFIPPSTVERFGPGETVVKPQPGDFLLTHSSDFSSKLIRWGQSIRYHGPTVGFAHWCHAAMFVDTSGEIVEAILSGVQQRNVSVYKDTEYHVIRLTEATDKERSHAVAFAEHCLNDRYGYITDLSLMFSLLTGRKFFFGEDGQMICSGMVARALERTGAIFQYDSWHMLPADVADAFNVLPTPGVSKGTIPDASAGVSRRSGKTGS